MDIDAATIFNDFCASRKMTDDLVVALGSMLEIIRGGGFINDEDVNLVYVSTRDDFKAGTRDLDAVFTGFCKDRNMDANLVQALFSIREVIYGGGFLNDEDLELVRSNTR